MADNKYLPQKAKKHALKKAEEKALERILFAANKSKLESSPVEMKGPKSELFEPKGKPSVVKGSVIDPNELQSKISGTTEKIKTKAPQRLISGSELSKKTDDILKKREVKRNLLKTLKAAEDSGDLAKAGSVKKVLSKLKTAGKIGKKLSKVVPGVGAAVNIIAALASDDASASIGNALVEDAIPGGLEVVDDGGDILEKLKEEHRFQEKAKRGELEDTFKMFGGDSLEERERMSRLARKNALQNLKRR